MAVLFTTGRVVSYFNIKVLEKEYKWVNCSARLEVKLLLFDLHCNSRKWQASQESSLYSNIIYKLYFPVCIHSTTVRHLVNAAYTYLRPWEVENIHALTIETYVSDSEAYLQLVEKKNKSRIAGCLLGRI